VKVGYVDTQDLVVCSECWPEHLSSGARPVRILDSDDDHEPDDSFWIVGHCAHCEREVRYRSTVRGSAPRRTSAETTSSRTIRHPTRRSDRPRSIKTTVAAIAGIHLASENASSAGQDVTGGYEGLDGHPRPGHKLRPI
jgi:hypothetical protein